MAWIACPESADPEATRLPASRPYKRVKSGALDRVYTVEASSDRPRLLDKDRDIDPSSQRRKGSVISWVRTAPAAALRLD